MTEFIKYPKIKRIGEPETKGVLDGKVSIQEKIDGGNFRFAVINGKLIFGSRTRRLTSDHGEDTNVAKGFKRCIDYVREKVTDKIEQYPNMIFFGENCVKHTINYDWEKMPPFLGFDIYSFDENRFMNDTYVKNVYHELGLETVPYLESHEDLSIDLINDDLVPISKYALHSAKDKKAEGIVIKNYEKQIFAKYVRDAFKEKNAVTFGSSPKYNKVDDTNDADFVFRYCTNARIEKIIFKLINDDNELSMKLMGDLIRQTYLDIIEEEWQEILTSNWKIDFKNVKKMIAPRCRSVLEQVIMVNTQ